MTIAEGTQFGPYRLIEKIGAGGMGEVYRVLDTRLQREVALKLVSDSYLVADAEADRQRRCKPTTHLRKPRPIPAATCRMSAFCAKRVRPPH